MKLDQAIQSVLNELPSEDGQLKFSYSEAQRTLDNPPEDEFALIPADIAIDVLGVELHEAPGYDALPEAIWGQMARNAWDFGERRANLLLQGSLQEFDRFHHMTGELGSADVELAHKHELALPGVIDRRRAALLARVKERV